MTLTDLCKTLELAVSHIALIHPCLPLQLFSSVESVKRQLQLDLTFVNVDWFGLASEVGTLGAANGLLGLVRDARSSPSSSPPSPFSTGSAWICRLPPDASDSSGATPTPRRHSLTLSDAPTSPPAFFAVDSLSSQGSLVRFSSVESFFSQMDASFFVVMEQLPAMLKHIGVGRELLQGGNALVRRGGSDADDVIGGSVTGSFSGTNVNGVNNAAGNAASSSGLVGHLESLLGSAVLLPASQLFILAAHTIELAYGSGEAALPPAPDAFVDATQMQPAPGAPSGVGGSGSGGAPDVSDISPAQSMRFSVVRATGLFFGSSSSSSNEDQLRKAAAQREKERRALEGVLSGPPAFHPLPCRLMQRYHDGARPRGLAAILKTVGTSRLTPSRWAPIAAFEIARQNALDMFLGRNLQRHLPVTLRGGRGGRGSWSALQRVVQRVDAVPVAALHGGTAAVVAAAATLTTKERSLSIGVGGAPRASPLLAPLPLLGGASASYAVVASPLCTATLSAASDEYEAVALESRWPSSLLALFSGAPAAAAGPLWEHDVTGADVEVTLALSSPCRLALVALTVQWTSTDLSAPQSVEVWAGATLDAMRPRLQGVTLPRVAPGTQLVYAVDAESALKRPLDFYDFYADEGAAAEEEAVRFVRVALSGVPAGVRMTVGAIDLYGAPVDCADERLGALASIEEHGVSKLTANALRMIESGGSVGMEGGNSVVGRLRAASLAGGRTASSLSSSGYEAMGRRIRAEVTYLQQASVLLKDGSGAGGGFGESVSLLDALSLDETRLRLNLSVATRDNLLATIGAGAVAAVDPNRHVYPRDPRLAAPPASTRGNVCQRQECTQPLAANMDRCRRCTRTLCRACMAASPVTRRGSQSGGTPIVAGQSGVGSPLLASGQLGGQSMQPGGTPMLAAAAAPLPPAECRIPEFCWTQTVPVCPDCHRTLVQQESLLARIVALKGEFDPDDAAAAADDARFAAAARARQYDVSNDVAGIVRPLDLAVAASVPHDRFSAPISAALISDTGRPRGLQWFYVGDVGSGGSGSPVHIVLVLLRSYRVRGVRLTADRLGIARQDAPGVRVEATVGGDASSLALLADHASLLTLYQSQGGAADSHASTGIPPNHVVDVAWSRVVVPRYVIVTLTPPASGLLHLGGIALLGEPLPSARASLAVPRTLFSPRDTAPEQQVQASVRVERAPVKVAWARHRPGRTRVDIGVEPFRMSGVALTPRAYEGRRDSQVREVRVLEAVVNQKGDLVSEAAIIASLIVPRVPSGTTLFFDHVAEIRGNVVSIECLDNYGERVRAKGECDRANMADLGNVSARRRLFILTTSLRPCNHRRSYTVSSEILYYYYLHIRRLLFDLCAPCAIIYGEFCIEYMHAIAGL